GRGDGKRQGRTVRAVDRSTVIRPALGEAPAGDSIARRADSPSTSIVDRRTIVGSQVSPPAEDVKPHLDRRATIAQATAMTSTHHPIGGGIPPTKRPPPRRRERRPPRRRL